MEATVVSLGAAWVRKNCRGIVGVRDDDVGFIFTVTLWSGVPKKLKTTHVEMIQTTWLIESDNRSQSKPR